MWTEYSKAKDDMFIYTNTEESPWVVIPSDSKRHAQLDCIWDILKKIPFEEIPPEPIAFPDERIIQDNYVRMPIEEIPFAPLYHQKFLGLKPTVKKVKVTVKKKTEKSEKGKKTEK